MSFCAFRFTLFTLMRITTKSEKQTIKLGRKLAQKFKGGEIVGLVGELGSGKTILVKGIAQGLEIKKTITSPTFVLMKIYNTNQKRIKGQIKTNKAKVIHELPLCRLCHIDAYRTKNARELVDIGVSEYLGEPHTVCVIEWAEKVKKLLPKKAIIIKLSMGKKENERKIVLTEHR